MITAIIQARMGSSRLPGKVMLDICGKPVLWHVVERVKQSEHIDKVIVATSEESKNDVIREFCSKNNILSYSGSETDVLDRFYQTAKNVGVCPDDTIIRITADCPFIDPKILDKVIRLHSQTNSDYTSNAITPTFPDGLDCEAVKFSALSNAWENARLKSEREHVTLYIRNHPEMFTYSSVKNDTDLSALRWTLDAEEDFNLIQIIYERLYKDKPLFLFSDILELLKNNPELSAINAMYVRNEGLLKSLAADNT